VSPEHVTVGQDLLFLKRSKSVINTRRRRGMLQPSGDGGILFSRDYEAIAATAISGSATIAKMHAEFAMVHAGGKSQGGDHARHRTF
jgi:hypothetical protein